VLPAIGDVSSRRSSCIAEAFEVPCDNRAMGGMGQAAYLAGSPPATAMRPLRASLSFVSPIHLGPALLAMVMSALVTARPARWIGASLVALYVVGSTWASAGAT
jgi:hypothetical protein